MALKETRRVIVFELSNIAIIIPVIFLAMIYQSNNLSSQLRMCVYVILATLSLLVKDQSGADNFVLISIVFLLIALVLMLKLDKKKDVADD